MLFLLAVLGSGGVVASLTLTLPAEQPVSMADPLIDSADFYRTHFPDRAARNSGRATTPGEATPGPPAPIAGLNQAQTDNAYIIVEVGKQLQLPRRAYVVAIATALQETYLRNLANPLVPASLKYPHEGVETNYDSIGVFQQRPSMGWGTVAQLMDPVQAAARFYSRLMRVSGWQAMSIARAAQAVQRSAFPGAYAKHEARAEQIVEALT